MLFIPILSDPHKSHVEMVTVFPLDVVYSFSKSLPHDEISLKNVILGSGVRWQGF